MAMDAEIKGSNGRVLKRDNKIGKKTWQLRGANESKGKKRVGTNGVWEMIPCLAS